MADKVWIIIDSIEWDSSGRGVMVRGGERSEFQDQMYYVSYPSGKVTSITNDANNYIASSATIDFKQLCVVQQEPNFQLFFVPYGDTKKAKKISDEHDDGVYGLAVAKDGQIYYTSSRGGGVDIRVMDQEGNAQRQITSSPAVYEISITPNESQLLFSASSATEVPGIWRMNFDGSGLKQLSSGNDYAPVMEPGGRWIFFQSFSGPLTIMKIPAEGGNRVDVSGIPGFYPMPSPDGKTVYFAHIDEEHNTISLWSVPIDGGKPAQVFEFPPGMTYLFISGRIPGKSATL